MERVGEFIEETGLPSITGESGGFISIIPGIGAFASFSPKLDHHKNSIKGIATLKQLGSYYNEFNLFYDDIKKDHLTNFFYQK